MASTSTSDDEADRGVLVVVVIVSTFLGIQQRIGSTFMELNGFNDGNGFLSDGVYEGRVEVDLDGQGYLIVVLEDDVRIGFSCSQGVTFVDLVHDIVGVESEIGCIVRSVELGEGNESVFSLVHGFGTIPLPFSVEIESVEEVGVVAEGFSLRSSRLNHFGGHGDGGVHSGLSIGSDTFELEDTHLGTFAVITSVPALNAFAVGQFVADEFIVSDGLTSRVLFGGVDVGVKEMTSPIVEKNVVGTGTEELSAATEPSEPSFGGGSELDLAFVIAVQALHIPEIVTGSHIRGSGVSGPSVSSSAFGAWEFFELLTVVFEGDIIDVETRIEGFGVANNVESERMELNGEFLTSVGNDQHLSSETVANGS